MRTYTYAKSAELYERAKKVIPNGVPGHLGTSHSTPLDHYPIFSERAQGAYYWDVDGNRFLDFMCAYGPNVLGYNDPDVDAAVLEQLKKENCVTSPSYKMIEFAELMVDTVDMADWTFFAKNGGDVTALSLLTARAATGRKKVILTKGNYHGVAPWMQRITNAGIIQEDKDLTIYVDWDNIEQIEAAIRENPGEIACLMSTPYYHPAMEDNKMPGKDFWQKVRKLCTDNGIVLAIDDVRCGFRLDMGGSDKYFGIKADLLCFCKALANGYNVAALCGTSSLFDAIKSVFYTGSYWLSAAPFAAGIACVNKLKKINGPKLMLDIGKQYTDGLVSIAKSYGYNMVASGAPSLFFIELKDSRELHEAWISECVRRGVFLTNHHNMFTCCAMTDEDIKFALEVADDAFQAVKARF